MYNMYSAMHILNPPYIYMYIHVLIPEMPTSTHTHFSSDGQNVDSIVDLLQFVDGLDNRSPCGY